MKSKCNTRVLFFTKYPYEGASSRYRVYQYLPYLKEAKIQFTVCPFNNKIYIKKIYEKEKVSLLYYFWRIVRRVIIILFASHNYNVVFVQKELFPLEFLSFLSVSFLKKIGKRVILDIDDAIWIKKEIHKPSHFNTGTVMKRADLIIAGNEFLYNYSTRYNKNTVIIPTVVDLVKYKISNKRMLPNNKKQVVLGWIGTPITAKLYLPLIADVINILSRKHNKIILKLIGSGKDVEKLFACKTIIVPWNKNTEISELCGIDIGLMPLDNSEFSKGKCGLKLLQYMACGKPVVASPVGVNKKLIKDGVNGFKATTQEEWYNALKKLFEDVNLRKTMGLAGRKIVEEEYSLQVTAQKLTNVLKSINDKSLPAEENWHGYK